VKRFIRTSERTPEIVVGMQTFDVDRPEPLEPCVGNRRRPRGREMAPYVELGQGRLRRNRHAVDSQLAGGKQLFDARSNLVGNAGLGRVGEVREKKCDGESGQPTKCLVCDPQCLATA